MNLFKYVAMFGPAFSLFLLCACSGDVAGTTEDENTMIAQKDPKDTVDVPPVSSAGETLLSSSAAVFVGIDSVYSSGSFVFPEFSSGSERNTGHPDIDPISHGCGLSSASYSSSEQNGIASSSSSSPAVNSSSSVEPVHSDWVYGAWTADTNAVDGQAGAVGRCIAGGPFGKSVVPVVNDGGFGGDAGGTDFGGGFEMTVPDDFDPTIFDSVSDTLFSERVKKLVDGGMAQADAENQAFAELYRLLDIDGFESLTQTEQGNHVVKRALGFAFSSFNRFDRPQAEWNFIQYGILEDPLMCSSSDILGLRYLSEEIQFLLPVDCSVDERDAEAIHRLLVRVWAGCRQLPVCDASSEGAEASVHSVANGNENLVCEDLTWTLK